MNGKTLEVAIANAKKFAAVVAAGLHSRTRCLETGSWKVLSVKVERQMLANKRKHIDDGLGTGSGSGEGPIILRFSRGTARPPRKRRRLLFTPQDTSPPTSESRGETSKRRDRRRATSMMEAAKLWRSSQTNKEKTFVLMKIAEVWGVQDEFLRACGFDSADRVFAGIGHNLANCIHAFRMTGLHLTREGRPMYVGAA